MKCPMCGNEIPVEAGLVGPWKVFQPAIHGEGESGTIAVCGQCYMLVNIADTLKRIEEKLDGDDRRFKT